MTYAADLAAALLVVASELSGLSIPSDAAPPQVVLTTDELMTAQFPECQENACAAPRGLYNPGTDYIIVNISLEDGKPLTPLQLQSVMVHELTHWLQYVNGLTPVEYADAPCELKQQLEEQAYDVQDKYLKMNGHESNLLQQWQFNKILMCAPVF